MTDLTDKTILVTHCETAPGAAAARACALGGARVLAHYSEGADVSDTLADDLGVRPSDMIAADLTIPEHPIALWSAAADRAARIHALVNIAGIYRPSFLNSGDLTWMESWRRAVQLNLTAPTDLCRASAPHFRAKGGGKIINVSLAATQETGSTLDTAFVAARAGLIGVSRNLARSLSAQGADIYMLAPAESDAAAAPDEREGLVDWVRGQTHAQVRDAEQAAGLIASLCATEDAPFHGKEMLLGAVAVQ